MARKPRGGLAAFAAKKPGPESTPAPVADPESKPRRRGQTLRLNPDALRELKILAATLDDGTRERRISQHDLLIEAVNDLFVKHGKKPLA